MIIIIQIINLDIPSILKFGIIGLGTIMAILAYNLLRNEHIRNPPRPLIIKSIYSFMIFALILTILGFYSRKEIIYPNIEGKWLYICTGSDSRYQHGGRFVAKQEGDSWNLSGERMWKDTINTQGKWDEMIYTPTKSWKSTWGNLNNDEIRFEYMIPNIGYENIRGYSEGKFVKNSKGIVVKVKGTFNQLFPSKAISGEIEFYKVTDQEFENPNWIKISNIK